MRNTMNEQVSFTLRGRNPDVLTCIANLSNDEVFTPPELAGRMLDMLAEAWTADHGGANLWADKTVHRKQGDYALAPADAHPHDEHGGDEGATVLLSMTAPDGILFEYFDENLKNGWTLSIEEYVENWNNGTVHGAAPGASKPTTA